VLSLSADGGLLATAAQTLCVVSVRCAEVSGKVRSSLLAAVCIGRIARLFAKLPNPAPSCDQAPAAENLHFDDLGYGAGPAVWLLLLS
jgi:hypothetical protein